MNSCEIHPAENKVVFLSDVIPLPLNFLGGR